MNVMGRIILWVGVFAVLFHLNAEAKRPSPPEAYLKHYNRAAKALNSRQFDEALLHLEKALAVSPDEPSFYNLRGAVFTHQKKYDLAEKDFRKAQELAPDVHLPVFNLAEVAFLQGDYRRSLNLFEQFNQKVPNQKLAIFKIFLCHLMLGNEEKVQRMLETIEESPDNPFFHFATASKLFRDGDADRAMKFVQSAQFIYRDAALPYIDPLIHLGWVEELAEEPPDSQKPKTSDAKNDGDTFKGNMPSLKGN